MFRPNRSLLNPKFEGYKLDAVLQESVILQFDLEHSLTQATVSGRSPLSFQEVHSRITHNHLTTFGQNGRALYVDADLKVIVVDIAPESLIPAYQVIFELPKIASTDSVGIVHPEYPSAAFLSSDSAFVCDGRGLMYLLRIPNTGLASSYGIFELPGDGQSSPNFFRPFRIHAVTESSPGVAIAILSSRVYPSTTEEDCSEVSQKKRIHRKIEFDIHAVQLNLSSIVPSEETIKLRVLWRRRGTAVPSYVAYDGSRNAFLVTGGSVYQEIGVSDPPSYEPSPDENAPIPRAGENIDEKIDDNRPPPYSWTQADDSLTIAVPLPSSISKSAIKVTLTPKTLSLHVDADRSTLSTLPLPHYSLRPFWDSIAASTSFWTWDREAEHAYGLLTLHLEKQYEGTKWLQVFASAGPNAASESRTDDIDIPETLDPSELWKIREALEKYTGSLRDGEDASGLGLGRGVPRLAQNEMDDEIDDSVGRESYVTWINVDGSQPSWISSTDATPFDILSTPLPGMPANGPSLVVKNGVDGLIISPSTPSEDLQKVLWNHTETFSALAFVLASKRDTRFTYHVPSKAVFAFDSGTSNRGGNVYIYRHAPPSQIWAKESILRVGGEVPGTLLGVGASFLADQRKTIILCLLERELVIIRDII